MKNIFSLTFFLISLSTFSQETYTMKSGGRIFNSKNERINSTQVSEEFNQEALKFYQAGRAKKTVGNILFWGGIITAGGKFIYEVNKPISPTQPDGSYRTSKKTLYYVGGALCLISIPIKLGFQNKIRKSAAIMNEAATKSDKTTIESTNLLVDQNGVGVSIKF